MSLLHTLALEQLPAPQQPNWKQLQTFFEDHLHDTSDIYGLPEKCSDKVASHSCKTPKSHCALFMAEIGSHPCCLWATSNTGMVAACLCPTGYIEMIASILYRWGKRHLPLMGSSQKLLHSSLVLLTRNNISFQK